jgi:hypothetical protein
MLNRHNEREARAMMNYPLLLFIPSVLVLWLSALLGSYLRRRRPLIEEERSDFEVVQTATLTLLALLVGFSFSMATTRYDLRKSYEEAEANAIGTEYVRADLLPPANATAVRDQLRQYTDLRIAFYRTRNRSEIQQINQATAQLQSDMWSQVQAPAVAQPTPVISLAVAGMNDVLNSRGYTQAAWWNRIPTSAWGLLSISAICCNILVGYGSRGTQASPRLLFVLPLVVSIAFLLIADIDSPRGGLIHVAPQNLVSLADSFHN